LNAVNTIVLRLTDLAYGGDAVGRHEGRAVFVPLGLPGETVRAEITEERPRFARARLVEVLVPSEDRVEPACPLFGRCGGCQLQHASYQSQLEHKRRTLQSLLARIGKVQNPLVHPTQPMDNPWRYRNHVQLSVTTDGRLGFLALRSNDIVPVERCPLVHPMIAALWQQVADRVDLSHLNRVVLRAGTVTGERLIVLEGPGPVTLPDMSAPRVSWVHRTARRNIVLSGDDHFTERLGRLRLRISSDSFFQVSTQQADHLLVVVSDLAAITRGETLLDAYCGVGTFALSLGRNAARVIGIEESPSAIADAQANNILGDRAEFLEGRVEEVLPGIGGPLDVAVLDPPRVGCAGRALKALASRQPKRIVYVSCDPATLARDLARLAELGYDLVLTQPVDMFPQTYHVETVSLLVPRP